MAWSESLREEIGEMFARLVDIPVLYDEDDEHRVVGFIIVSPDTSKERAKAWRQTPKGRNRVAAYSSRRKELRATPEYREKQREYDRRYREKKKAAKKAL